MALNDYGPLAEVVAYAGYMTAASMAVRVAWAGKLLWEPEIRDLAKAPARMAGVFSAVAIVLLFAYSRSSDDWKWLTPYAIAFALASIVALLVYIVLLAAYTIQCTGENQRTVAGFWRTNIANQILSGNAPDHLLNGQTPPASVRELFCGSGRDPDRIWPPVAQGLAKASLVAIYLVFISPATLSIATGAIILEKSSQAPKPKIQTVVFGPVASITSGGTSDGHSPFCQKRTVQSCARPAHGGHLILGSGQAVDVQTVGRVGSDVVLNTPDAICIEFWASTTACETEVSIKGRTSAVEEYQSP